MLLFVLFLCTPFLAQAADEPLFDPTLIQACIKKLGTGEDEVAEFFKEKNKEPSENILCLFKCAMEDGGFMQNGKVDKSKWPQEQTECLDKIGKIETCKDMEAFKDCLQ